MIRKKQIFFRAQDESGAWGAADIFDLNDESFRAVISELLRTAGQVVALRDTHAGDEVSLRTRPGYRFPPDGEPDVT